MKENWGITFRFNLNFDLRMYVHKDGEEFWISMFEFPTELLNLRLNTKQEKEMLIATLELLEKDTIYLNTDNYFCSNYPQNQETYLDCCKRNIGKIIQSRSKSLTLTLLDHIINFVQ